MFTLYLPQPAGVLPIDPVVIVPDHIAVYSPEYFPSIGVGDGVIPPTPK